jgi:hypothetical protein
LLFYVIFFRFCFFRAILNSSYHFFRAFTFLRSFYLRFHLFAHFFFAFSRTFFALVFLRAFALASTNRKKAPGAHLWVLLSLIATESVQESSEKLPPPVVMTSLAYIGTRPSAARKLCPSRSLFSRTTKALPSPLYTILTLRDQSTRNASLFSYTDSEHFFCK